MKITQRMEVPLLVYVLALFAPLIAATNTEVLPQDSIYHLNIPLTDQNGRHFKLADRRGQPMLITMFYTSCPYTCPRIIETLKLTRAAAHTNVPVLMVSFDSQNDTPAKLKAAAAERGLDGAEWTLAHAEPQYVRKLAALLGVQYRELAGGDFNHTSVITLLDGEGRIVAKTSALGAADSEFVKAVNEITANQHRQR